MELKCKIKEDISVKHALKSYFNISKRLTLKLKKTKQIYCNSNPIGVNEILHKNDTLKVVISFEEESENIVPVKMDLDILYEDEAMLVINKPPYMPVHPSINHYEDSLSNGVKYYFDKLNLRTKIRPVVRLDKNTSGIVIFAKNEYIQECLINQMKHDVFKKEYLAILDGKLDKSFIEVEANIEREKDSIITRCVKESGAYAKTVFEVTKEFNNYTLVKCTLFTGRTHQIRVHAKYIGHPVVGDDLYGRSSSLISRQALHAYKVKFVHPITKEIIEIKCDLPDDIKKMI